MIRPISSQPQGGARGKEPTCQFRRPKRHNFDPWIRKSPWRRKWQPTPVLLPGESHSSFHGVPKSCHDWAHTHTSDTRHRKAPGIAMWHTHAWPLTGSFLSFLLLEQLLKLLPSCSSCIVPRISFPANYTLGILLIGLWWTKAQIKSLMIIQCKWQIDLRD